MSQKFTKLQNKNDESTAFGKWFATAVYDQHFIETEELANYIQQQASVKKSDIKAVLDELGGAMKHYFELGQKVKLEGIGIFKVGFSSIGARKTAVPRTSPCAVCSSSPRPSASSSARR